MIRTVLYLLVAILLITFLRYVIGAVLKTFGELLGLKQSPRSGRASRSETAGELKRDPVCGTFVATSTSVKETLRGGEVVHFCSAACRDKYIESLNR